MGQMPFTLGTATVTVGQAARPPGLPGEEAVPVALMVVMGIVALEVEGRVVKVLAVLREVEERWWRPLLAREVGRALFGGGCVRLGFRVGGRNGETVRLLDWDSPQGKKGDVEKEHLGGLSEGWKG